jgi:hypothetical protein
LEPVSTLKTVVDLSFDIDCWSNMCERLTLRVGRRSIGFESPIDAGNGGDVPKVLGHPGEKE